MTCAAVGVFLDLNSTNETAVSQLLLSLQKVNVGSGADSLVALESR